MFRSALRLRSNIKFCSRPLARTRFNILKFAIYPARYYSSTELPKIPATELFSGQSTNTCWSCNEQSEVNDFFCSSCKVVQPPSRCYQMNYFEYFSVPVKFAISLQDLQNSLYRLQKKLHPDKFQRKSELQLRGHDVLSESQVLVDPDLLEEVLMAREEVRDAESDEVLEAIAKQTEQKYTESVAKLKANFEVEDFEAAKQNTVYLQYTTKVLEELETRLNRALISQLNGL